MSWGFWKSGLVARLAKGFWFCGGCCACWVGLVPAGLSCASRAGLKRFASGFAGVGGSCVALGVPVGAAAGVPCAAVWGKAVGTKRAAKGLAPAAAAPGLPNMPKGLTGGCGVPVVFV